MDTSPQKIVNDLKISGLTTAEISVAGNCTTVQINNIAAGRRGENLSYHIYNRLHALWLTRCGNKEAA